MNELKMLSLFDGSGGFPLAGSMCGIEPVAASEIEPFPIRVTTKRFPKMKHLGDISKVSGADIEPVDVISFGSPCQDLSIAGKRAGLKHEENGDDETTRSGLFMEAVRIIKEMRKATNGIYPRIAVWENVPGAFSSNKGEDFRIVLEELIKIAEPSAVMPPVPKTGWAYSDSYVGDGWSIAYRVFDAQYWGVPQRRRRIYLVADFRGECAGEILFERQGLRGYFETSRTTWESTSADAERSFGTDDRKGIGLDLYNLSVSGDKAVAITANTGTSGTHSGPTVAIPFVNILNPWDSQGNQVANGTEDNVYPTLRGCGGAGYQAGYVLAKAVDEPIPYTLKIRSGCEGGGKGALIQTDKSATLSTLNDQYLFQPIENFVTLEPGIASREGGHIYEGVSGTLRANAGDNQMAVAYAVENQPADSRVNIDESGKCQTLTSRMGTGGGNVPMVMEWNTVPIHDQATRFNGKRGDKQDGKGNGLGVGNPGDPMNTLTATDRHAVGYAMQAIGEYTDKDIASALKQRDYKDATDLVVESAGVNSTYQRKVGSLCARDYKGVGSQYVSEDKLIIAPTIRYIVRRLTPLECCRLQGFPDWWVDGLETPEPTEDDLKFWREVFETHRKIVSGSTKSKTDKQIIKFLKDPYSDSAIYKMWGNGIALPNALYVMQGITEELRKEGNEKCLQCQQ